MFLTTEEREMLLRKSNNRCSHCGKMLTLETLTCDHVIPISKGSDNDYKNMVALCEECNRKKADSIIVDSLGFYYKYLNQNYLEQTMKYADEYIKNKDWITYRNFLPSDITYFVGDYQVFSDEFLKYKKMVQYAPKFILKHVDYSDLDKLLDYWCKRYRPYKGTPQYLSREVIKEVLDYLFLTKALYIMMSGASKEIVCTYAIGFEQSLAFPNLTVVTINNLSCSGKYVELMATAINNQVVQVQNNVGVAGGIVEIEIDKTEPGAIKALNFLCMSEGNGFHRFGESENTLIYATKFTKAQALKNQKSSTRASKDIIKRASRVYEKKLLKRNAELKDLLSKEKYKEIMETVWLGDKSE